jgi:hypothetical protein
MIRLTIQQVSDSDPAHDRNGGTTGNCKPDLQRQSFVRRRAIASPLLDFDGYYSRSTRSIPAPSHPATHVPAPPFARVFESQRDNIPEGDASTRNRAGDQKHD